jgi:hypothetical protein
MLHTAEVRWFVPGRLPDAVFEWFWHGARPCAPSAREDRYLLLPGCETVGVKLRWGTTYDVKARVGPGHAAAYPSGVEGVRERWVKWSCDDERVVTRLAALSAENEEWLVLRKERYLRLFSMDSARPVEVDAYDPGVMGCHVELTGVMAGETNRVGAWTFGLEAYGERERLVAALDATVLAFFSHRPNPPVPLTAAASMGYPAWLSRLSELVPDAPPT